MRPERRRARVLLIGTFLIFFLPIVAAWLLNLFAPDWRPFGTVNHGILVQPVRPISAAGLKDPTGMKLDADYLHGRWTLVHVLNGPCGQRCIDALVHTRQVQQALGDDMNRVQRLMVVATPRYAENVAKPPELALAVAKSPWLASFSFAEDGSSQAFGIYLVDPQGNLMMRYPPNIDQRGLISDMERLLKISKIG